MQTLLMGGSVSNPPQAIVIAEFIKAYPGYTARDVLQEDVDMVLDLWAVEMARRKVENVLAQQR